MYSSEVYLAEDNSNPDSYIAKFIICDFGRNRNGTAIDRAGIENWLSTLKNKPLVGNIKMRFDGTYDFTGHNIKIVEKIDENGNAYKDVEFDTNAFGSFFDVSIETINDKECIVASCEIWKRFPRACEIIIKRIQQGTLHTSWEISVEKSHQGIVNGLMTKIIDVGRFIGHCLLGADVSPAYDSSGLLEIASTNYDIEFAEALSQDIVSQGLDIENETKEVNKLLKNNETMVAEGNIDETISNPVDHTNENETEVSQLTEYDLREKIRKVCREKLDQWCWISFHFPVEKEVWLEVEGRESELDFVRMTYTVENDTITVSEPENVKLTVSISEVNAKITELESEVSSKDEAIIKSGEEITKLKAEIAELTPFKEKFEKAEQERISSELAEKKNTLISSITKSGLITKDEIEQSEELQGYVDSLDEKSLKAVLADRYMASLNECTTEVSQKKENNGIETASTNLEGLEDEVLDVKSIMRKYFSK